MLTPPSATVESPVASGTDATSRARPARSSSDGPVTIVKALLHGIAILIVSPAWLLYYLSMSLAPQRRNAWFQTYSQMFSLVPGVPGIVLRRAFYGLVLPSCPRSVTLGFGTILSSPDACIGHDVYVGAYCTLGKVSIGDDVLIGSNVDIMSGTRQHHIDRLDIPIRHQGGTFERVHIGRDVWIGNSAVVAADIADQSIVAAGAVVVKPVASRVIVGGNPARVIRSREEAASITMPTDAPSAP